MICKCHICLQVQHHFYLLLSLVEYLNFGPTHDVLRKSWQCGESRCRSFDWHAFHLNSQTTVSANQQSCDSHRILSAVLEKWKGWNLRNWLHNQLSKRIICSKRRLFQTKDYFKCQGHISPLPEHGDGLQKWSAHFWRKENNLFLHIWDYFNRAAIPLQFLNPYLNIHWRVTNIFFKNVPIPSAIRDLMVH